MLELWITRCRYLEAGHLMLAHAVLHRYPRLGAVSRNAKPKDCYGTEIRQRMLQIGVLGGFSLAYMPGGIVGISRESVSTAGFAVGVTLICRGGEQSTSVDVDKGYETMGGAAGGYTVKSCSGDVKWRFSSEKCTGLSLSLGA